MPIAPVTVGHRRRPRVAAGSEVVLSGLFALAAARFWLDANRHAALEAARWRRRANRIADGVIREHAVSTHREKGESLSAVAAFAAFTPAHRRGEVVRASVAFQCAFDFIDTVAEHAADPIAAGYALNCALIDALSPAGSDRDYWCSCAGDDGGYLRELAAAVRGALATLPGRNVVLGRAITTTARIVDYQSLNHGDETGSLQAFREWGQAQRNRGGGLHWWEAAAANGSTLPVIALFAAAARGRPRGIAALESMYWPWVAALSTLLDSTIDREQDAGHGHHSLVGYYDSPEQAAERLAFIAREARAHAEQLSDGHQHRILLAAIAGYFATSPLASSPSAKLATDRVLAVMGQLAAPMRAVFDLQRRTAIHTDRTALGERAPGAPPANGTEPSLCLTPRPRGSRLEWFPKALRPLPAATRRALPRGPRTPSLVQTLGVWSRPTAYLEQNRARFGPRFTGRPFGQPPFVILSRPDEVAELFRATNDTLHAGEGARVLEWLVGPSSLILLDEAAHLKQRRVMLAAFHSRNVEHLSNTMQALIEREIAQWPCEKPIETHPRLRALTMEIVLRTVFGLEDRNEREEMQRLLAAALAVGESPLSLVPLPTTGWLARHGPVGRVTRTVRALDSTLFALIKRRRASHDPDASDVLALLLDSTHDDGSPLTDREVRDELITALVAGHETTAAALSWAFVLLSHSPRVTERLHFERDADRGDSYLTATINEVLRRKPVLPFVEPRLVVKPITVGGIEYPPGVVLVANAYLTHHDPQTYPDPYAFRPERFLEAPPGTYSWIPFGGGTRRCTGLHFAMKEIKLVLGAALQRYDIHPAQAHLEATSRRGVTICPANGGRVILAPCACQRPTFDTRIAAQPTDPEAHGRRRGI